MLHALAALQDWHKERLPRPVTVLLVSDEEVGSDSSLAITGSLAKKAAAVLVLEPSYGLQGAVKTARKGVGEYLVKVTGKASHAVLDFQKGVNAILELAHQIEKVSSFTDLKKGLTINVGVRAWWIANNIVPAEAAAQVDVRIARLKDGAGIDKKMRSLRPYNRKCKIEVTGGISPSAHGTYRREWQHCTRRPRPSHANWDGSSERPRWAAAPMGTSPRAWGFQP